MGYISIVTHRPRGLPGLQHSGHEKKWQKMLRIRSVLCFRIQGFQGFRVLGFRVLGFRVLDGFRV